MALPPEIAERLKKSGNVQVPLRMDADDQAIVEGKTAIPFGTLVQLILKKKVQVLFKEWQDEPIIFSSVLLTKIASTPNDTPENRSKLVLTALTLGLILGVCFSAIVMLLFSVLNITIGQKELITLLGAMLVVGGAVYGSMRVHASKHTQKLVEQIEQISDVFSK